MVLSLMIARSGNKHTNTNNALAVRYVITALGSHIKGERIFGHTPLAKSYGNTHRAALHGLPTRTSGAAIKAEVSENTVKTSAALVIGLRHSACVSLRIAEIMIPAWLIPIQNTKLVIKNPHITGLFRPVTPTPLFNIYEKAATPARNTIN